MHIELQLHQKLVAKRLHQVRRLAGAPDMPDVDAGADRGREVDFGRLDIEARHLVFDGSQRTQHLLGKKSLGPLLRLDDREQRCLQSGCPNKKTPAEAGASGSHGGTPRHNAVPTARFHVPGETSREPYGAIKRNGMRSVAERFERAGPIRREVLRMASHQSPEQKKTVQRVMHEFKHGELKSAAGARKVKNPRQAIAIALHEAGASRNETPKKNAANLRRTKAKERRGETYQDETEGRRATRRSHRRAAPSAARDSGSAHETRAELYAEARRRHIPNRSKMSKSELAHALGHG